MDRAPKLADFIGSEGRENATVISDFRQSKPYDGHPASASTTAYLSYDAQNLYVIFDCQANRKTLRAHLSKRDDVSEDETVSVSIDTFHDRRHAYMFFVNPLGVQMDGVTTEGQNDDFSFDAVWRSEGRLTPSGYIVLMAIPFKSLRFSSGGGKTWGFSLSRYIPDKNEVSTYPRISRNREGYVEQFATLEGLDNVATERALEFTPYLFMAGQRFFDRSADRSSFIAKREVRAGLDAKAVIAGKLTLDATVNPDFSQVESDEPQVTLNQRYEVYFPEHRPFFLENSGYFDTPETLFFSRRIVNPGYGARLTGRVGAWSVGLLGADDRGSGENAGSANIQVVRVERDLFGQSTVGGLVTSLSEPGLSNRVYSFDTRLRFKSNWVLTAQAAHSETEQGRQKTPGSDYFVELERSSRNLSFYSYYRDRSPSFRSDLGYIPRIDIRQFRNVLGYRWGPSSGTILSYGPSLRSSVVWDHRGRLQDWDVTVPFHLELKGQTTLEVSRSQSFERFLNLPFRENNTSFSVASDRLRHLGLNASWDQGRDVNYYPARGHAPSAAKSMEGDFGLTLRPNSRLRFDETYIYSRLAGAESIFTNHVARAKVNFQFNRSLSIRAILDYNAVLPNQALVAQDRAKLVTGDILLTYLVHPGTVLYAGYTNRLENLRPPYREHAGFPGTSTGTQFFVKLSYLMRP